MAVRSAFSFHERITEDWERLNDAEWSAYVEAGPSQARWTKSFVVSE